MEDPVTRFSHAVETASITAAAAFAPGAVLDATVPNWRFIVQGSERAEAAAGG